MAKKKKEKLKEKRPSLSQKQLLAVSIVLSLTIAVAFTVLALQSADVPFSTNAVIIDQLGMHEPNPEFVENATAILEGRGFNVEYYNYTQTDVEFFEGLAKGNYGIIILRTHAALRVDNSTVDIFTSERWPPSKNYPPDLVVPGSYLNDPQNYSAITYSFIEKLEGRFPKSIVVAMGCFSLKPECRQLAEAFINRGAKAYIGWTSAVSAKDTDKDTLIFLGRLLIQNKTLEDAVENLEHVYYDPALGQMVETQMTFYPFEARKLTITDLLVDERSPVGFIAFMLKLPSVFVAKVDF